MFMVRPEAGEDRHRPSDLTRRVEDGIPLAQGIAGSPRVPAGGPSFDTSLFSIEGILDGRLILAPV